MLGQSLSTIANHAVSRLRPLTIMCWRKMPSNVKPKRRAAARDGALRASHFHSRRRTPRSSKACRHPDVADFDDAVRRVVAHKGTHAEGLVGIAFHESIEPRVARGLAGFQPLKEGGFVLEGAVAEIGPDIIVACAVRKQRQAMMRHTHMFKPHPAAIQRAQIRFRAGGKRVDDIANRFFHWRFMPEQLCRRHDHFA
jgi:hypothetical protein